MIDPKMAEKLAKCFSDSIPSGMRDAYGDMEKNFNAALQSFFSKLDLVTREEFEAQKRVLEKTRMKLDALEKVLKEQGLVPDSLDKKEDSKSKKKN